MMPLFRTLLASALAAAVLHGFPLAAQGVDTPPPELSPTGVVLPGDQVKLRIEREPEMGGLFTVDSDGDVLLPRLGTVRVGNLPAVDLKNVLATAYAEFLRNPAVEVQVLRRVAVQGEVVRPGLYMVDLTKTLRDVIVEAGGVTEAGHTRRVHIVRGSDELRLTGEEAAVFSTAELMSGDRVVIPRRHWIVRNPQAAMGSVVTTVVFLRWLRELVDR